MLGTELLWRFSVSGLSTMLLLVIFIGLAWCLVLLEQEGGELSGGQRGAGAGWVGRRGDRHRRTGSILVWVADIPGAGVRGSVRRTVTAERVLILI